MTSVYFVVTAFTKICTPAYEYAPIRTHSLTNARPAVYHKSIIGKTHASCDQLEIILYDINNAIFILAFDKIQRLDSLMKVEQYLAFLAGLGRNHV